MWRYELHIPRLMSVATLPCESRTVKYSITVEYYQRKLHQTYHNMLHRNGPVDYKIVAVMHQCVYGTMICDIYDLEKCLTQTSVDFEHNVIEAAIDQWRDSLRSYACWWRTLWTHAAKLLFICIICFIRTFGETINVIWCIWQIFCC